MNSYSISHRLSMKSSIMKDWNKEGLFLAKGFRFYLPKSPRDRSSF